MDEAEPMDIDSQSRDRDTKAELDVKIPTAVDFTGRPIGDISNLYQYTDLRKLTWRNLSNDDLVWLYTMYRNPLLQYLDVGRDACNMGQLIQAKPPSEYISQNLLSLNLSGAVNITNKILHHIVKSHPHLIELNLSCTKLLNIDALQKLTALTSLNVSHNYLDDGDAKKLATRFQLKQLDISHNELTDNGVKAFLDNLTLDGLNVSNQRTHYVKPQTIEAISAVISTPPIQQMDVKTMQIKTHFDTYSDNLVDFRLIYEQFPNVTSMTISPQTEQEDFSFIPKFKHLQTLTVQTIVMKVNDSIVYVAKSKTITELKLYYLPIGHNLKLAHALRKNKVLQKVVLHECYLTNEFIKIVLQSQSIRDLDVSNNIRRGSEISIPEIIPHIFKNDALFNVHFDYTDEHFRDVTTMDELMKIREHLQMNEKRVVALQRILPLLAATQLGGPLRHSILQMDEKQKSGILPMISMFLGVEPPTKDAAKAMSQQIEPVLGKRSMRSDPKSLPFMFE